MLEKFDPETVVTAVYYDGASKQYYVKRFQVDNPKDGKRLPFMTEHRDSKLTFVSTAPKPFIVLDYLKGRANEQCSDLIDLADFIAVKGWKALGNRLSQFQVKAIKPIEVHVGEE